MHPVVHKPKILLLSTNDPSDPRSYSGSLLQLRNAISRAGALAGAIHVNLATGSPLGTKLRRLVYRLRGQHIKLRMKHRAEWSEVALIAKSELASTLIKQAPKHDALLFYGTDLKMPQVNIPTASAMDATYAQMHQSGMEPYRGDSDQECAAIIRHQRVFFDSCSLIFPRSHWCRDSLLYDYDQPSEKLHVTFSGANVVPDSGVRKVLDGKTVLFVGLDWQRKNGQLALNAFTLARKARPDLVLHVVSNAPRNLAVDGVTFHRRIDSDNQRKLAELYTNASLFLLPSAFEPWGNVFVEAFAFGCPVILLDRCAARDIVGDDVVGTRLATAEPPALAGVILSWLNDPAKLRAGSARAFELSQSKLNWDKAAATIIDRLS